MDRKIEKKKKKVHVKDKHIFWDLEKKKKKCQTGEKNNNKTWKIPKTL